MQIGNRFRCYPTPAQAQTLLRWIGCQRFVQNAKVTEDRYVRRFTRKSLNMTGQYAPLDQQDSHFKSDELTPWLSEVPSVLLRNATVFWKQAYRRFLAKLGGRPVIQKRHGMQSAWLTSELFEFIPSLVSHETGTPLVHQLKIGTSKQPIGRLAFKAHRDYKVPAPIHISMHAGQWHLSFNYDDEAVEPSDAETNAWLMQFDKPELREMTVGPDRGASIPLTGSDGQRFGFTMAQQKNLLAQEEHTKRWQRRQIRRAQGRKNWLKAKHKAGRHQRYGSDVRRELTHQISHALASDPRYKFFVFEALKVINMTKAPKARKDENGRWLRNGAAARAGLNKAILASVWAKTKVFTQYKARRQGKLNFEVPAHYSSQECAACGHAHKDNRKSQSGFVCQSCKHTDNADHNAANGIAMRGVRFVLDGLWVRKKVKRSGILKTKVGAQGSKPAAAMLSTLGETAVIRGGGHTVTSWSLNQETPATALS